MSAPASDPRPWEAIAREHRIVSAREGEVADRSLETMDRLLGDRTGRLFVFALSTGYGH